MVTWEIVREGRRGRGERNERGKMRDRVRGMRKGERGRERIK